MVRIFVLVLLALVIGAAFVARPQNEADLCGDPEPGALSPSRDLYCIELVAAPRFEATSGRVGLRFADSPFTHSVTADGRSRFDAEITLEGLPPVGSLGGFTHYVAWVATPVLFPIRKLGVVGNGTTLLGPIDYNKFVVLITAEPSDTTEDWSGPIVLRGQSASTRMLPPDIFEFSLGEGGTWGDPAAAADAESAVWNPPPVPAGLMMLPALMELRPNVAPYLPSSPGPPPARPREVIELEDGDTLALEAGYVVRTIRGRSVTMLGFNGQYPGPLLQVRQSATVEVEFSNNIEWPTTVHWHGVRLDNASDGVPGVTQDPVPPGGRFHYTVFFKDAGIYWYHPHQREDVQQDLGLYGNMLVRSPEEDYFGPANRDEVLMLDDLLWDDTGPVPFGLESATHALMGRFGNLLLVNGEPDYALTVARGEVVRFFLTNVSNTRTFNLSLPVPMKVVGSDVGNFEREVWVESVVIAPAERYVLHARFDTPGPIALVNQVQAIDHINGQFLPQVDTLGTVHVDSAQVDDDLANSFGQLRENRSVQDGLAPFRRYLARAPDRRLVLTMVTEDLPFVMDRLLRLDSAYFPPIEWSGTMPMMNWVTNPDQVHWILRDPDTGRENMAIDWHFRLGEVVKIRLANERGVLHGMQHPIHLHGQRFLVLNLNGRPNTNLVWKDTVLLPVGTTADILVEMSNPGRWMIHCHIAEHLEAGMHTVFTVE
ncbi:MAG: multicopper oxidase family protein [Gemmatimonadales bacterium]